MLKINTHTAIKIKGGWNVYDRFGTNVAFLPNKKDTIEYMKTRKVK